MAPSSTRQRRGKGYTPTEDLLIIKSWIAACEDPMLADVKKMTIKEKMGQYFVDRANEGLADGAYESEDVNPDRGAKSLGQRFESLHRSLVIFDDCYKRYPRKPEEDLDNWRERICKPISEAILRTKHPTIFAKNIFEFFPLVDFVLKQRPTMIVDPRSIVDKNALRPKIWEKRDDNVDKYEGVDEDDKSKASSKLSKASPKKLSAGSHNKDDEGKPTGADENSVIQVRGEKLPPNGVGDGDEAGSLTLNEDAPIGAGHSSPQKEQASFTKKRFPLKQKDAVRAKKAKAASQKPSPSTSIFAARGRSFSPAEDLIVARAWIAAHDDPSRKDDLYKTLMEKISEHYTTLAKEELQSGEMSSSTVDSSRNFNSVSSRFKVLHGTAKLVYECYKGHPRENGESDSEWKERILPFIIEKLVNAKQTNRIRPKNVPKVFPFVDWIVERRPELLENSNDRTSRPDRQKSEYYTTTDEPIREFTALTRKHYSKKARMFHAGPLAEDGLRDGLEHALVVGCHVRNLEWRRIQERKTRQKAQVEQESLDEPKGGVDDIYNAESTVPRPKVNPAKTARVHAEDARIYGFRWWRWPSSSSELLRVDDGQWMLEHGDGIPPLAFSKARLSQTEPEDDGTVRNLRSTRTIVPKEQIYRYMVDRCWHRAMHAVSTTQHLDVKESSRTQRETQFTGVNGNDLEDRKLGSKKALSKKSSEIMKASVKKIATRPKTSGDSSDDSYVNSDSESDSDTELEVDQKFAADDFAIGDKDGDAINRATTEERSNADEYSIEGLLHENDETECVKMLDSEQELLGAAALDASCYTPEIARAKCKALGVASELTNEDDDDEVLECPRCSMEWDTTEEVRDHFFGDARIRGCCWPMIRREQRRLIGVVLERHVRGQQAHLMRLILEGAAKKKKTTTKKKPLDWHDVLDILDAAMEGSTKQTVSPAPPPVLETLRSGSNMMPLVLNPSVVEAARERLYDRYADVPL